MSLDVLVTTNRLRSDPEGRALIEYLRNGSTALGLDDAVLYYDFPIFLITNRHAQAGLPVSN